MKSFILSLVLLTACAAQQTYPKLPLADRGDDITTIIKYVFQQKNLSPGPWQNWRVILITEPIIFYKQVGEPPKAEVIVLEGLTIHSEQTVMVYDYQPCLAASSMIHELYHAIGYSHVMHPNIWENEVEDLTQQAIRDLCGEDYVPLEMPEPTAEQLQKAVPLPESVDY